MFDSSDRGGVEIKDGASDAYVANCYAEACTYEVVVQDYSEYPSMKYASSETRPKTAKHWSTRRPLIYPRTSPLSGTLAADLATAWAAPVEYICI